MFIVLNCYSETLLIADDVRWPAAAELSGMSSTPSRQADHQSTTVQQYGKSKFYVRRLQLDTGSYTDSEEEEGDDEGSSTDEFNTAEFGK